MPAKKAPTDHLPKSDGRFHFDLDGKGYSLPPAEEAIPFVDGGMVMDAALGDEAANAKLAFTMLQAVADPDTLAALRAAPGAETVAVVLAWSSAKVTGVNLPESSRSSV